MLVYQTPGLSTGNLIWERLLKALESPLSQHLPPYQLYLGLILILIDVQHRCKSDVIKVRRPFSPMSSFFFKSCLLIYSRLLDQLPSSKAYEPENSPTQHCFALQGLLIWVDQIILNTLPKCSECSKAYHDSQWHAFPWCYY